METAERQTETGPTIAERLWSVRRILGSTTMKLALGGVAAVAAVLAVVQIRRDVISRRELAEALAEADRLDPGWRYEEIEARREPVPDAENSAFVAIEAAGKIPEGASLWLYERHDYWPIKDPRLDRDGQEELRRRLRPFAPALAIGRRLAGMPRGRLPSVAIDVVYDMDGVDQKLREKRGERLRDLACGLYYDAGLRAAGGDPDGGLESCRALLNLARMTRDDPSPMLWLSYAHNLGLSARAVERVLAHGRPSEPELSRMQAAFEEELRYPAVLMQVRKDRAIYDELIQAVAHGRSGAWYSQYPFNAVRRVIDAPLLRSNRTQLLHRANQLVEAAKGPESEAFDHLKPARDEARDFAMAHTSLWPRLVFYGSITWPGIEYHMEMTSGYMTFDSMFRYIADGPLNVMHDRAYAAAAVVALAEERFHHAEGRWPASVEELSPRWLARVPADPFTGLPLVMRLTADGCVIYSVGTDRKDDGGLPPNFPNLDNDFGIRLFNPEARPAP